MAETVYPSRARVVRERGPFRQAWLPAEEWPVVFGVHSEIAERYGVSPDAVLVPQQRTRVRYRLSWCPEDRQAPAQRAHSLHTSRCPVARSIGGCIDISTDLEFV